MTPSTPRTLNESLPKAFAAAVEGQEPIFVPTVIFTDASSVVEGRCGDRMAKSSRWLATRYAMIRWAERCKTARIAKLASRANCADIMTKCLTGELFMRHRATVLGLPEHEAK